MQPVYRFAPSPNGALHLGHAYSALLNYDLALANDGQMLLRMEDIDTARCSVRLEGDICQDLKWLGVEWQWPIWRQSEHFARYQAALERLQAMGMVYPAFMSRGQIRAFIARYEANGASWPRDFDGAPLYPGNEREHTWQSLKTRMEAGESFAWRLNMEKALLHIGDDIMWREIEGDGQRAIAANPRCWGDVILARRDVPTSYHLAVCLDDHAQGVTHVVRGRDLYHSTSVHRVLQLLLSLREPLYHHHRLIEDKQGRKLSKSDKDCSLKTMREEGVSAAQVRALIKPAP